MPIYGNTARTKLVDAIIVAVLAAVTIASIFPILNMLVISFSDKSAVVANRVTVYPIGFTLANYKALFNEEQFFISYGVSLKRVLLGASLQILMTVMMAYPLSRSIKQFAWRNVYMWAIVFTMLFSGGLIPWYMTIRSVGLIDTIWALVLPRGVPVFNVILLMNFFRNLPKELDEAAEVDGAGPWYTMFAIYIPLSLPGIATVSLFSIVEHWNAFFDGLILINSSNLLPLQTYINTFVIQPHQLENMDAESMQDLMKLSDLGMNGTKVVVSMIPIMVIYPYLQKYFIHGIVLGSVKE